MQDTFSWRHSRRRCLLGLFLHSGPLSFSREPLHLLVSSLDQLTISPITILMADTKRSDTPQDERLLGFSPSIFQSVTERTDLIVVTRDKLVRVDTRTLSEQIMDIPLESGRYSLAANGPDVYVLGAGSLLKINILTGTTESKKLPLSSSLIQSRFYSGGILSWSRHETKVRWYDLGKENIEEHELGSKVYACIGLRNRIFTITGGYRKFELNCIPKAPEDQERTVLDCKDILGMEIVNSELYIVVKDSKEAVEQINPPCWAPVNVNLVAYEQFGMASICSDGSNLFAVERHLGKDRIIRLESNRKLELVSDIPEATALVAVKNG